MARFRQTLLVLSCLAASVLSACATPLPDNDLPYEGNVKPEDYVHVSGAVNRRNANVETAKLLVGVTAGAAVGVGVANATNSNVVSVPVVVPSGSNVVSSSANPDASADCFTEKSK